MPKIAFIGAGSFEFTRGLVRDILSFPALADSIIALMDIVVSVSKILKELKEINFDGFLSLEPYLAISGKMSGFSGAKLFKKAARALKEILNKIKEETR